ncbi:36.4 kDa proline-rich protein-like [Pyrus ussuriensis x Pyrus communis]|uniref:36.4 kDa proline-rich protein-like n=1 Tax=Pyrus ussuriensis x Pyrus communis TaxID=2448454 RepID=A0A5N5F219_9ROSA|nr:36.4 kDa proline-rich protein-like [Pyrus ussuriensis x Pyrus communis]KAB2618579.1 36.4 kDa proline-rich protein-like [Pyrus ussuriensis x Pyrus communis]
MAESSKLHALFLICLLFISSASPILGCGYCGKPKHKPIKPTKPPKGPIVVPPIHVKPPGVKVPPVTVPPIVKPPVTIPPIVKPPVTNPPSPGTPCPPPPGKPSPASKGTCPIDTLKLGACVDLLGGLVHIGLGDPAVNECCPVLQGLAELEAAVCLCTTLKIKLLNLNIFVPLALQLLVTCGKSPPPGYTCSL